VVAVDMASAGSKDMTMMGCTDGQRRCSGNLTQVCSMGQYVNDRACPMDSKCADGRCTAPPSGTGSTGKPCDQDIGGIGPGPSENQCTQGGSQNSCQPFLTTSNEVAWICGRPVGMGFPGTKCTSGSQCRSGFCGDNGYCFRACKGDFDCPQGGGVPFQCVDTNIVVDGKKVTAGSCIPL
jgi:hypothetical protein